MDSFGRLPSDVISEITELNNVLEVTFVADNSPFYRMILKTLHYECKFWFITSLSLVNGKYSCASS
jgi:hypothetical protein